MGVFTKRVPPVRVHRHWYGWWDRRPMWWWVAVGRRVKERRVTAKNRDRVRAICAEVDRELRHKLKESEHDGRR